MTDVTDTEIINDDDSTILVKTTLLDKASKLTREEIIPEDATQLALGKYRLATSSINKSQEKIPQEERLEDNPTRLLTSTIMGSSLTDAIKRTNLEVKNLKSKNSQLKIIKQRFLLSSKLGIGGMGAVYQAKDLRKVEAQDKNPWVALKLLSDAFKEHPTAFIALQREAQKSQKLAHPNIVRVYDFDRDGDTVYMTMELLKGEELKYIIKRKNKGIERGEALSIIRQVGGALVEAHKHNIVHSDFKPGNIFYTEDKVAKVFDFGIARAVSEMGPRTFNPEQATNSENDVTTFDVSTLNALTPAYASKEMHEGQDACKSDDVYALGCVAYEILSGLHPYGKTPANKVKQKNYKLPFIDGLKRKQVRALQKSIAIDRENRYQTVEEFLTDFLPERRVLSIAVKISLSILVIALCFSGVLYYEQQQEIDAQKLAAEKVIENERNKSQQIESAKQEVEEFLDEYEKEALSYKKRLDELAFVSSSTSLEWQLAVTREISNLESVYSNNIAIINYAKKNPEEHTKNIVNKAIKSFEKSKDDIEGWLGSYHKKISNVYLSKARDEIKIENFPSAQTLIDLARKHFESNSEINTLQALLLDRWQNKKEENKEILRQQKYRSFEIYNETAARHVSSCIENILPGTSGFNYNMKVLQQKLTRLKKKYSMFRQKVDAENRVHVKKLGQCIRLYGETEPIAAESILTQAKTYFPSYLSVLENVKIRPFDSCDPNFAGKGRRYTCSDRLMNNAGLSGPELVVVRSKVAGTFAIGKYEVTQRQFSVFCKNTKLCSVVNDKELMLPATGNSLEQINSYIDWLNRETGFSYRLPTHLEWSFSARGRDGVLDNDRNCQLNARGLVKGVRLLPVDVGSPNGWGLVNSIGNAEELILDTDKYRVAGGSILTAMESCGLKTLSNYSSSKSQMMGFRVVRKIES